MCATIAGRNLKLKGNVIRLASVHIDAIPTAIYDFIEKLETTRF